MFHCFFLLLLLVSCSKENNPPPPSSSFENTYLLFDMKNEVENIPCPIKGKIPHWLSGTLFRNGPAKFSVGDARVDWFDGLAMLHSFSCKDGKIFYSNKFLQSSQYYIMEKEKSLDFSGFAQSASSSKIEVPPPMKDIPNADVSIQKYTKEIVALTEIPYPVVFDTSSLKTLGLFSYEDSLKQGQWECAHPLQDPVREETINYFVRFGAESCYVIWKMEKDSSLRKVLAEIPVENPSYMHSFGLTKNYVILTAFPLTVKPIDLLVKNRPFIENYIWHPKEGTTFYIINRNSAEVITKKTDPFFAFHHVNAFEEDRNVLIDIVTYPNPNLIKEVESNKKSPDMSSKLERFTFSFDNEPIARKTLFTQSLEFPKIRMDYMSKPYLYCYAVDARFPSSFEDARCIYKINTTTKKVLSWSEKGCFPGEPIFVPRPGSYKEDDGVILSFVLDFANKTSFLLILSGETFIEHARVEVPNPVPVGLHGLWEGA